MLTISQNLTAENLNIEVFKLILLCQSRAKCDDSDVSDLIPMIKTLLPYAPENISALRFIDLALTLLPTVPDTLQIAEVVAPLVSSQYSAQRLLSSHILATINKSAETEETAYSLMYKIEKTAVDVFNYRDHLMWLDKMRPGSNFANQMDGKAKVDIVRFLFGTLFRNFKLLWEPTMDLIVAYAEAVDPATFWSILKERLDFAAAGDAKSVESSEVPFESKVLSKMFEEVRSMKGDADVANYRNLLWTTLAKIPTICDMKNRDIVGLYLEFYHQEFLPRNK